jgi:hypothetical protein
MEKGKDFENRDFRKSKRKRVWKLNFFSKIEKGKKERVFFCRNQKRKKGKDFFWKPGKERKNADSSYFQQNTNKNTHNHNFFIVFGRYMFQNVGCTLMKSFWDNKPGLGILFTGQDRKQEFWNLARKKNRKQDRFFLGPFFKQETGQACKNRKQDLLQVSKQIFFLASFHILIIFWWILIAQ